MTEIKMNYDEEMNSLHIWFDEPEKEDYCDEVNDDISLMKDKNGRSIGIEDLNYAQNKNEIPLQVSFNSKAG